MERVVRNLNTLSAYLALRDIAKLSPEGLREASGAERCDLLILFGGSIPYGCRLAGQAYTQGLCERLMIVGGVGHTTAHLRNQMHSAYPMISTEGRCEADIIADYLKEAFGIGRGELILERESTNCGENVIFALRDLRKMGCVPGTVISMQDSSMQRRMGATFAKVWVGEPTRIFQYAAYQAEFAAENGALTMPCRDVWGMWSLGQCITLLMGEIPRLTDDAAGYGPRGKNYIAHVDIPAAVAAAYENLLPYYAQQVRPPWSV